MKSNPVPKNVPGDGKTRDKFKLNPAIFFVFFHHISSHQTNMKDPHCDKENEQINATTEHSPPPVIKPKFSHSYACDCKFFFLKF